MPKKKNVSAAAETKFEDWRCAACHWVGSYTKLTRVEYEGDFGSDDVCPECKSPDVFEDDPEEWARAAKEHESAKRRYERNKWDD